MKYRDAANLARLARLVFRNRAVSIISIIALLIFSMCQNAHAATNCGDDGVWNPSHPPTVAAGKVRMYAVQGGGAPATTPHAAVENTLGATTKVYAVVFSGGAPVGVRHCFPQQPGQCAYAQYCVNSSIYWTDEDEPQEPEEPENPNDECKAGIQKFYSVTIPAGGSYSSGTTCSTPDNCEVKISNQTDRVGKHTNCQPVGIVLGSGAAEKTCETVANVWGETTGSLCPQPGAGGGEEPEKVATPVEPAGNGDTCKDLGNGISVCMTDGDNECASIGNGTVCTYSAPDGAYQVSNDKPTATTPDGTQATKEDAPKENKPQDAQGNVIKPDGTAVINGTPVQIWGAGTVAGSANGGGTKPGGDGPCTGNECKCQGTPQECGEGSGSVTGGMNCDGPPQCENKENPVDCYIARMEWTNACVHEIPSDAKGKEALEKGFGKSLGTTQGDAMTIHQEVDIGEWMEGQDGGSMPECMQDTPVHFNFFGMAMSFDFPFSMLCPFTHMIRGIIICCALLLGARIYLEGIA